MSFLKVFSEQTIIDLVTAGKCDDLTTLLKEAISENKIRVVTFLSTDYVRDPITDVDLHENMIRNNYVEIFSQLLAENMLKLDIWLDVDHGLYNMLQYASYMGHVEIVRLLLAHIDPGADKNYAIRLASKKGHYDVVNLLLICDRVNPSDYDNYAIKLAIENGHQEIVKLLISKTDMSSLSEFYHIKLRRMNISTKKDIVELDKSIKEKNKQFLEQSDPQMRIEEQNGKKYACFIFEL